VLYKFLPNRRQFRWLARLGLAYVLDFDDLVTHDLEGRRIDGQQEAFDRAVSLCLAGICGNAFLAQQLPHALPTLVLPSPVPTEVALSQPRPIAGRRPLVGWVGLATNHRFLDSVAPALARACRRVPFDLVVLSDAPYEQSHLPVRNVRWSLDTEQREIANWDIGIMPLPVESAYSRGKCSYKALQYMSAALPCIASDVGMNREVIADGESGLLAASNEDWEAALVRLLGDVDLRGRLGARGRAVVLESFGYDRYADRLADFLRRVLP
jgi:glycosyltransferase involved in cell wall biosynthesis